MSLLASNPGLHNLKFLEKMERHYHKRGSSQFINRQKPVESQSQPLTSNPTFTTKIPVEVVGKLEQLIKEFMNKVNEIIRQFKIIDHYGALQILRKHQFFSDVAVLINGDLYGKIQELQRQILAKQQKIIRLKHEAKIQTVNDSEKLEKLQNFSNKNMIKFNPSKSVAANIFYHARALDEEDFIAYYNKTSLSNPITIKKVQNSNRKDPENISEKLSELITAVKHHSSEQSIQDVIQRIRSSLSGKCRNPCCQQKPESPDTRLNKAKTLINSTSYKPTNNIYKSDKSEEYFKRYYKGNNFNLHDVTSLSRTKMQEMEKIENLYNKNLKARKKYEVHQHRYSCSFSGH